MCVRARPTGARLLIFSEVADARGCFGVRSADLKNPAGAVHIGLIGARLLIFSEVCGKSQKTFSCDFGCGLSRPSLLPRDGEDLLQIESSPDEQMGLKSTYGICAVLAVTVAAIMLVMGGMKQDRVM